MQLLFLDTDSYDLRESTIRVVTHNFHGKIPVGKLG